MHKSLKIILGVVLGFSVLCIGAGLIFYFTNQALPTHSKNPDVLDKADRSLLLEANHLRVKLGGKVWPGWEQDEFIPFVAYNESNAFLVGLNNPETGWRLPLKQAMSGNAWQPFTDAGDPAGAYYLQPVQAAERAVGAFTVQIGDTWAGSLPTYEWFQASFFTGMRSQLPPLIRDVFPFALSRPILLGGSERYVPSLLHEAFHAYQAAQAPNRLVAAERVAEMENEYPWTDPVSEKGWQAEAGALYKAIQADNQADRVLAARQFLILRQDRRTATSLSAALVDYERQREWLEGLAKYVELSIGHTAALDTSYQPLALATADADFRGYSAFEQYYGLQIYQAGSVLTYTNEVRFYYTGMAQALLLDRVAPGWKEKALKDAFLEELLAEAVK